MVYWFYGIDLYRLVDGDYKKDTENINRIDEQISKILDEYKEENIETITHRYSLGLTHNERFEEAENLLKKYATAKLVITTRIHCALPCLALGTPVILVVPKYDKERFDGLFQLFNIVGKNQNKRFLTKVLRDENNKIINPSDYKIYAEALKLKVENWLNND